MGRLAALAVVLVALAAGAVAAIGYYADGGPRTERLTARAYVVAWTHGDYARMYSLLSPAARRKVSPAGLARAYREAAATATVTAISFSHRVRLGRTRASVAATIRTRAFGTVHASVALRLDPADPSRLDWGPEMAFPGLAVGERLHRTSVLGPRGTLLAADGTPLAEGPGRTSPIPTVAGQLVGRLGPIAPADRARFAALGYPADAQVGQDGLELIFQRQLGGRPGGTLLAGRRLLARRRPDPGATVHTTISPALETATIAALGGAYAGMTVLDARTGAIEAAAGIAFTALQPPGSTFKIITAAAALQDHVATLGTTFPYATTADVGGYVMQNAGGEACGGSLLNAFAVSCDTAFAPLGIELGARRLVAAARAFGFDEPTGIPTALESTIPSAETIGGDTAVGSTAIGQGLLDASTLEIADVGAAIANHGRRPLPTLDASATPRYVTATSPAVAAQVQQLMQAVVSEGTGRTAQISGYEVAGKTGTAELANTANQQNDVKATDAWFVGYVPDSRSDIVACALFPSAGHGADTAAPAVRSVLASALGAG